MKADRKRIGIFGGSFDPVHEGHVRIAGAFLGTGMIDQLWVMPTPDPPFKSGAVQAPFAHRLEMAKLAFSGLPKVSVSDYEANLEKPSFTFNTLRQLKRDYPTYDWAVCIGEDNLRDFHLWKNHREILEMAGLIVAARPGFDSSGINRDILSKATFTDNDPMDISSSGIRDDMKSGIIPETVPGVVRDYIRKNRLYGLAF